MVFVALGSSLPNLGPGKGWMPSQDPQGSVGANYPSAILQQEPLWLPKDAQSAQQAGELRAGLKQRVFEGWCYKSMVLQRLNMSVYKSVGIASSIWQGWEFWCIAHVY